MLGIYEKRHFSHREKIWLGRYQDLTNVLHWHFECELIRVVRGKVTIKIGDFCAEAVKDDCFFCSGEELHSMISQPGTQVEIAILDESLAEEITDKYTLLTPKLPKSIPVKECFAAIKKELSQKGPFYREAMENHAKGLLIDIFRSSQIVQRKKKPSMHKELIAKINHDFSFLTFDDAVRYCGYSPSHFSKMFKTLTGMTFSEYLNIIRVENAIMLLRDRSATVTSVSQKCGFATIRNFNRVFKKVTGYSPRSLPTDFMIDTGLRIAMADPFDPTDKASILL